MWDFQFLSGWVNCTETAEWIELIFGTYSAWPGISL